MNDSTNQSDGARDHRPRGTKAWTSRDARPRRDGGHSGESGAKGGRGGRDAQGGRGGRDSQRNGHGFEALTEEEKLARALKPVRSRHDDPEIPEDAQPAELDRIARNELKTLSKENADGVARHLVMVARLIEDDPKLAHRHAVSAARRAGRIGVVRETLAITAYSVGDFALALRELRTYRRISGSNEQLPMMVDSERGIGRPDRALELGRSVDRSTLTPGTQALLAIAMSGARLDEGNPEQALRELEVPQLDPARAYSYSPDLFHAYAEVLEELGRTNEGRTWRQRAEVAAEALNEAAGGADDDDETINIEDADLEGADLEAPGTEAGQNADDLDADDLDADDLDADDLDADDLDTDDLDTDDDSNDKIVTAQAPAGVAPAGVAPTGVAPTGPAPTGPAPTDAAPTDAAPTGPAPTDAELQSSGGSEGEEPGADTESASAE